MTKLKLMTLEESRALDAKPETLWWYYWEAMAGRMPPTHRDYVPVGFFRKDSRDGRSWPVAIWIDGAIKSAQVGSGQPVRFDTPHAEADFAEKTFQYCCQKPIAYDAYEFWKANRKWPPETGTKAVIEESLKAREVGIGDNSIGPANDHATFLDQVNAALAGLEAAAAVDSDEKAGSAQALRSRLNELAGEGDKLRVVEKEPHLKASRDVDEKWMPTIREAKDGAAALRKAIEAHETKKLRVERDRAAAEQARLAAEAAARRPTVTQAPAAEAAPAPAQAPAQTTRIAGSYGRATSAKKRKQITSIDYRRVFDKLVDSNDELKALLTKLAQRVIDAGGAMDGVEYEEVASIR